MKPQPNESFWRKVAYLSLFWLVRCIAWPFARYIVLPFLWLVAILIYAAACLVLFLIFGEIRLYSQSETA